MIEPVVAAIDVGKVSNVGWWRVFGDEAAVAHVRWIDLTPQQARLVESPLGIRQMLSEQRQLAPRQLPPPAPPR